jgi:DNA-binding CsgD family transcriptional regulator
MRVGPLSLGATHRVVQARLGAIFARPTLLRVHEASGGNPFYALELARALTAHDAIGDPTRPLPVPETLEELVRARLEALPDATREALVLAAALGRASPAVLWTAGVTEAALEPALDARVIERDGVIRFTHPLLASVLYQDLSTTERRAVHRRLAEVVPDPVGQARHLALATEQPDSAIAATLDAAAKQASARGAVVEAAELGEHALRLTPPGAGDDRHQRTISAARAHLAAGEVERAEKLARELEARSLSGSRRAEALLLLSDLEFGLQETIALRRQALREASEQPELQVAIHRRLGLYLRFSEGLPAAEKHARAAVELAEQLHDDALRAGALGSLALVRFNAGRPDAVRLAEQAHELALAKAEPESIEAGMCLAHVLVWSCRLEAARALLEHLQREWGERDEAISAQTLWYLSLVELWAGRWSVAFESAERAREIALLYSRDETEDPSNLFPQALIAAHRGDFESARELAAHCIRLADKQGALLPGLGAVMGIVDLWSGDAAAAAEDFAAAERMARKAGWVDPWICWWRDELVEALLELGKIDDAQGVLTAWEGEAKRLGRAWVLARARRCRGLVAAARGDVELARSELEQAVELHEAVGDPFGRARALLALGVVRRRARQKRAAREAIDAALGGFEALGAAGWAARAQAELGRIGGRRREEGLTPAERRVAALVAEGRTNREVAAALFLGERTVETHLTHVYAKLGIRSRTELARKLR